MGKDDVSILSGDDESDTLWTLLAIIGFESEGYEDLVEDDDFDGDYPELVPTREDLNAQLLDPYSKLNVLLSRCKIGYLDFLVLGFFILRTGAILPLELKEKILKTAAWETDEWRWKEEFKEERKKALQYFRSKIENHIDGKVSASEAEFY